MLPEAAVIILVFQTAGERKIRRTSLLHFFKCFFIWVVFFFKSLLNMLQIVSVLGCSFLAMRHVGSQLPDQGLNPHPIIRRWSLNHWTEEKGLCFLLRRLLGSHTTFPPTAINQMPGHVWLLAWTSIRGITVPCWRSRFYGKGQPRVPGSLFRKSF